MKRKFNLKFRDKIESGEVNVITRNGRSVRIVCWDAIGDYPIVALVKSAKKNFETTLRYDREGVPDVAADESCRNKAIEFELFVEDSNPDFTDFEKLILNSMEAYVALGKNDVDEVEFVKLTAYAIRNRVLEELSKTEKLRNVEAVKDIAKYSAKTWEESFAILTAANNAYEKGREEVQKKLPKWRKSDVYNGVSGTDVISFNEYGTTYYLSIDDLRYLPRE
jgi:hypothetical protein